MDMVIRLQGTRPMLQHNGRMANPLDKYTKALKELTAKRNKTDDDLYMIRQVEARGACWETEGGEIGLPTAAVWRCIYDAAKAYKKGEDIKRALSFEDRTEPLLIDGATIMCDAFIANESRVDYRPVKIAGKKTMRARPLVVNWVSTHAFTLLEEVINPRDMFPILERAGLLVGVGDWRPTYGCFVASAA